MDPTEIEFRQRELDLEEAKFAYAQDSDRRQRRSARWTIVISATLSALAVAASVLFSARQLAASQDQFERTSRATYYRNIVDGLGSDSVAVQTNSMQLLVEFVRGKSNYEGDTARQRDGARDAIQVLTSFIQDLSRATSAGLPDYLSPEPVIMSRAMTQVKKLSSDESLGAHSVDISRASMHGVSLPYFQPQGTLLAVAADFRRANLRGLALHADGNSFRRTFFTCAILADSVWGKADLQFADLSGADLRGADLRQVRNLRSEQLAGATIDRRTTLPPGVAAPARPWGARSQTCVTTVNRMTGMIAGQGFDPELLCPMDRQAWATTAVRKRFTGALDDLVAVCRIRRSAPPAVARQQ